MVVTEQGGGRGRGTGLDSGDGAGAVPGREAIVG